MIVASATLLKSSFKVVHVVISVHVPVVGKTEGGKFTKVVTSRQI